MTTKDKKSLPDLRALLFKTEPTNQSGPKDNSTEDRDENEGQEIPFPTSAPFCSKPNPQTKPDPKDNPTEDRDDNEGQEIPSHKPSQPPRGRAFPGVRPGNEDGLGRPSCSHSFEMPVNNMLILSADRVDLVLQSIEATLAHVDAFSPEVKTQISPAWLAMVTSVSEPSPWIHSFIIVDRSSQQELGSCGFKGPPDSEGMVELAYGIENDFQGRGYATEAAQSLVTYAINQQEIRVVRAHTLLDNIPSQRVLTKCGFHLVGEVQDPEDGLLLRWELRRN